MLKRQRSTSEASDQQLRRVSQSFRTDSGSSTANSAQGFPLFEFPSSISSWDDAAASHPSTAEIWPPSFAPAYRSVDMWQLHTPSFDTEDYGTLLPFPIDGLPAPEPHIQDFLVNSAPSNFYPSAQIAAENSEVNRSVTGQESLFTPLYTGEPAFLATPVADDLSLATPVADDNGSNHESSDILKQLEESTQAFRLQQRDAANATKESRDNYKRHVRNYAAYCGSHSIPAFPVTAAKVANFLKHETTRTKKTRDGIEATGTTIGHESVNQCVSALEDHRKNHAHEEAYIALPESQRPLRSDKRITDFVTASKRNERVRAANAQKQKMSGKDANSYILSQLQSASVNGFTIPKTATQVAKSTRDRSMLFLTTSAAFRGDSIRGLEWSNLSVRDLPIPEIGPEARVKALVLLRDQGKHNQAGEVEEHGLFRHYLPELCGIGALAFHFFAQFHVRCIETPRFAPDFTDIKFGEFGRRDWWNRLVYPGGKDDATRMSYENHRKCVVQIHEINDIHIGKATHGGRSHTTVVAREGRATREETRCVGKWKVSDGSYSRYDHELPFEGMLAVAGFNARRPESYMLARNCLDPPKDLEIMLFPFIEKELLALDQRCTEYGRKAEDYALRDLLRVLTWFRRVLLQDAAMLRSKYPDKSMKIMQYAPFNTPEFSAFADSALQITYNAEEKARNMLSALPQTLATSMQGILLSLALEQQKSQDDLRSMIEGLTGMGVGNIPNFQDMQVHARNVSTPGSAPPSSGSLEMPHEVQLSHQPTHVYNPGVEAASACQEIVATSFPNTTKSAFEKAQDDARKSLEHLYGTECFILHQWKWLAMARQVKESTSEHGIWVPIYHLAKDLDIRGIWNEWSIGLDGKLSLQILESGPWEAKWKNISALGGKSVATVVCRRKAVANLIRTLSERPNWTVELALRFLDERYHIPTKTVPHLRTVRAFIAYLQAKGGNHIQEIVLSASTYP